MIKIVFDLTLVVSDKLDSYITLITHVITASVIPNCKLAFGMLGVHTKMVYLFGIQVVSYRLQVSRIKSK